MNNTKPKYYHGILAFILAFIYLMFISSYVSSFFISLGMSMYGIVATQVVLVSIAVISAVVIKVDFKETFPIRLPSIRQFFGAVFTYIGVYLITLSISNIIYIFFPSMQDTVEGLSSMTNIMPNPIVAVIVIALLPAVCEELLMRGFILSSFSEYKSYVGIVIVGVMFGILHFDVYRFVPTTILGIASAYIVLKTKSLILPMLYHFINNTISVMAMYQLNNTDIEETVDIVVEQYIGSILIFCSIALIFGYIGLKLLNKWQHKKIITLIVIIISITLFIAGISLMISNIDISAYSSQLNMLW